MRLAYTSLKKRSPRRSRAGPSSSARRAATVVAASGASRPAGGGALARSPGPWAGTEGGEATSDAAIRAGTISFDMGMPNWVERGRQLRHRAIVTSGGRRLQRVAEVGPSFLAPPRLPAIIRRLRPRDGRRHGRGTGIHERRQSHPRAPAGAAGRGPRPPRLRPGGRRPARRVARGAAAGAAALALEAGGAPA